MQYSARTDEPGDAALKEQAEALVQGLGMELIELDVFRSKSRKGMPSGAQVRAVIYKPGVLGTDDCAQAHRAILPRLELAFPGDLSVEVTTPGINRVVKDGMELAHYRGRGVRLWRTDTSDWSAGLLEAADEQGITIKGKEGEIRLDYALIAKAKLDPSQEEDIGH
ncbi:MAG: ribosome assembly cofactor RimP [Treponema sp.]|nr:ribosome assembly cofactor RimP [Treponema sp.]